MDEPAPDRPSSNLIVALVVLVAAVVILVVAAVLVTRSSDESVGTGAGTTAAPGGTGTTAPETTPTSGPPSTPTPPTTGTTPTTGAPGAPGGGQPTTCNESAPVPRPSGDGGEGQVPALRAALVGCPEAGVNTRATAGGWTIRVVSRDGEDFAVTMDLNPRRLNLTIVQSTVTDVSVG